VTDGRDKLLACLERLVEHYDIDRWHWRDDTPAFDVCVGAVLVQHTAWSNVEKALAALRAAGVSDVEALSRISEAELAGLIRPAGTPAVKARRLKALAALVRQYGGFEPLFRLPESELRALLLSTHGIGPETADVILLYAARHAAVVHDAYTARLCRRLGVGPERNSYEEWRRWLRERLPLDLSYRWRAHATIVVHCKERCRAKPRCHGCPALDLCAYAAARPGPDGLPSTQPAAADDGSE